MTSQRRLVVMPTYNEAGSIEGVLGRIRATVPAVDVLVVDDGSPDGTGELVDQVSAVDAQVFVLHRTAKQGLGAAYLAGFGWGLARGYDVLIEMDADGSHLPEQLPRLLDAVASADLVLGSRWIPGGRIVNWPRRRELLSRCANTFVRIALSLPLRDATGGYRAYRRETLEAIGLETVVSEGYCFQIELARRAVLAGLSVVEVPITFVEREFGESKMSGDIVTEALVRITQWSLRYRFEQLAALIRTSRLRAPRQKVH